MDNYIIAHALQNVWCNPPQNSSYIIKPARINPPAGSIVQVKITNYYYPLPTNDLLYSVFQVGNLDPRLINLLTDQPDWLYDRWYNFEDLCNQATINPGNTARNVIADIYQDNGLMHPKSAVYYMYTNDHNFVIAIANLKTNHKYTYTSPDIWLKFYTFAGDGVNVISKKIVTAQDITDIIGINSSVSIPIADRTADTVIRYVNGVLVDNINSYTVNINDYVELVVNPQITNTVIVPINTLQVFDSNLDSIRKYLFHYSKTNIDGVVVPDGYDHTIAFLDDVEFYVRVKEPNTAFHRGFYLHKNLVSTIRMVTNRDYSIAVDRVATLFDYITSIVGYQANIGNTDIYYYANNTGAGKGLIYENSRINELYKLPTDAMLVEAMVGVESTCPEWTASALESSAYVSLFSQSKYTDVTIQRVEQGYGYNALSVVLGASPKQPYNYQGTPVIDVSRGLGARCTCYEYDADGILLGYYHHNTGAVYTPTNPTCVNVELVSGYGTTSPGDTFGGNNIPVDETYDYRLYVSSVSPGGTFNTWTDVTAQTAVAHHITNGLLIIDDLVNVDPGYLYMVRTNKDFLAFELDITPIDSNIRFPLALTQDRGDGVVEYPLNVPYGDIDVFVNGKCLVEDIGYYVTYIDDTPYITIIDKGCLIAPVNTTSQHIHVRAMGLSDSATMRHNKPDDIGYIYHGRLSSNSKFDIRDDRNMSIWIGGKFKDRSTLVFGELDGTVRTTDSANGLPYKIRDIIVPMVGLTFSDTYTLKHLSDTINTHVSDYLTRHLPEPTYTNSQPSAILERYAVYSPFFSKIMYDMLSGDLPATTYSKPMSDQEVIAIGNLYDSWYKTDPLNPDNPTNFNYVIVHPFNHGNAMAVNYYQFLLLTRLGNIYAHDRLSINDWLTVTPL